MALDEIQRQLLNDLLPTQSSLATVREREKGLAQVSDLVSSLADD